MPTLDPVVTSRPPAVMLARALPRAEERDGWQRPGWAYEPKWDGFRGVLDVGEDVRVWTRHQTDVTACFPEIAAAGADLPPGTMLDGELVIWGGDRLDFTALQRRIASPGRCVHLAETQPASFMVFDLLALAGEQLRPLPLRDRRGRLEKLSAQLTPPLHLTPQTVDAEEASRWFTDYAAAGVGVEGLVAKRLDDPYRPGHRGWVKVKSRQTTEAVVGAVTGTLDEPSTLVLGLYDGQTLRMAGGTVPLRREQRSLLAASLRQSSGAHSWPSQVPARLVGSFADGVVAVTAVEPFVVEVAADSAFERGRWRHPVRFVRARPDLAPMDVERG